jgi:hypothetical protein
MPFCAVPVTFFDQRNEPVVAADVPPACSMISCSRFPTGEMGKLPPGDHRPLRGWMYQISYWVR